MIKEGSKCVSGDEKLGTFKTMQECAQACKDKSDCRFFIYGKGNKAGQCHQEYTSDASCTEGWQSDSYDFYAFKPPGQGGTGKSVRTTLRSAASLFVPWDDMSDPAQERRAAGQVRDSAAALLEPLSGSANGGVETHGKAKFTLYNATASCEWNKIQWWRPPSGAPSKPPVGATGADWPVDAAGHSVTMENCAKAAAKTEGCGDKIMFSQWSYDWGCMCCAPDDTHTNARRARHSIVVGGHRFERRVVSASFDRRTVEMDDESFVSFGKRTVFSFCRPSSFSSTTGQRWYGPSLRSRRRP